MNKQKPKLQTEKACLREVQLRWSHCHPWTSWPLTGKRKEGVQSRPWETHTVPVSDYIIRGANIQFSRAFSGLPVL